MISETFPSLLDLNMPLSAEQTQLLKTDGTEITFCEANPKKVGSKAWDRYDKYKKATTVGDACRLGAQWQDLSADFEKEILKFKDADMNPCSKRAAPQGTPDREASTRAKTKPETTSEALELAKPHGNLSNSSGTGNQVEMSAATIAILRSMMREEIAHGMGEVEARVVRAVDETFQQLQSQIASEREARVHLEDRIRRLEQATPSSAHGDGMVQQVDKSVVVMGGFGDKSVGDAEALLRELLQHVDGFQDVTMTENQPPFGLVQFSCPAQAMKFIRSQKTQKGMQESKLWASENRSRGERCRVKIVSKLKKLLIELGGFPPKDVIASYKLFKIVIRSESTRIPVAMVNEEPMVDWLHDEIPTEPVKVALHEFISDME